MLLELPFEITHVLSSEMPLVSHNRVLIYSVLLAAGMLGATSDVILNQWARTGRTAWLLASWVAWIVVATLLGVILRLGYFGFGAAVVLFLLINSGAALLFDRILFGGKLTPLGWAGVGLALAAIACIEIGRDHSPAAPPGVTTPDAKPGH